MGGKPEQFGIEWPGAAADGYVRNIICVAGAASERGYPGDICFPERRTVDAEGVLFGHREFIGRQRMHDSFV